MVHVHLKCTSMMWLPAIACTLIVYIINKIVGLFKPEQENG